MGKLTWGIFISIALFFIACNNKEQDPYLSLYTQTNTIAGDWQVISYKVDGEETRIFIDSVRTNRSGCDTQFLLHRDSLQQFLITFGKNGAYLGDRYVSRIDTSFLPPDVTDTACTNPYNYTRTAFDTIINEDGFWTFTGVFNDETDKEQFFTYDRKTKTGKIWDIITMTSSEISLYRKYYKQTPTDTFPATEELYLVR